MKENLFSFVSYIYYVLGIGIGLDGIELVLGFFHVGSSTLYEINDVGDGEQRLKSRE